MLELVVAISEFHSGVHIDLISRGRFVNLTPDFCFEFVCLPCTRRIWRSRYKRAKAMKDALEDALKNTGTSSGLLRAEMGTEVLRLIYIVLCLMPLSQSILILSVSIRSCVLQSQESHEVLEQAIEGYESLDFNLDLALIKAVRSSLWAALDVTRRV